MSSSSVKHYFPYKYPRKGQIESIVEINSALCDYDHVVFSAGTGFGKSAVARTLCNFYKDYYDYDSFILTATKMLQNQYLKESANDFDVKYNVAVGRGNYHCLINDLSCNDGECKIKKSGDTFKCNHGIRNNDPLTHEGCEYWEAKANTILADVAIMNYNVLMSDNQYVNHYPSRYLMICDEAHNIEDKVMNEVNVSITKRLLGKLGLRFENSDFEEESVEYWLDFLDTLIENAETRIEYHDSYGLLQKDLDELTGLKDQLVWKVSEIRRNKDYWVVNTDSFKQSVQIKPLRINEYCYSKLLQSSKKHVYMSGTFVDMEQFCKDIGLDVDEVYFLTSESSFDMKKNNPIYKRYAGNLAYRSKKQTLPRCIPILKSILKEHQDSKGLIHCNSREFSNYIIENLDNDRLMTYYSDDKEDQIERFRKSENKVMASYSMTEGVDLPYDDLRFQIFLKVPYLSLADNQVKARLKLESNWYNTKTVQTLLQAWGRGMRAEDDYCTNYLIDTGFNRILHDKSFEKLLPAEFRGAIQ